MVDRDFLRNTFLFRPLRRFPLPGLSQSAVPRPSCSSDTSTSLRPPLSPWECSVRRTLLRNQRRCASPLTHSPFGIGVNGIVPSFSRYSSCCSLAKYSSMSQSGQLLKPCFPSPKYLPCISQTPPPIASSSEASIETEPVMTLACRLRATQSSPLGFLKGESNLVLHLGHAFGFGLLGLDSHSYPHLGHFCHVILVSPGG